MPNYEKLTCQKQNNIWWVQEALLSLNPEGINDVFDMACLNVELWDGDSWINQGLVSGGSHLLEEFLIPLDLSLIPEDMKELKIRLRSGAAFFEIDQVSIDFSNDEVMEIHKLELDEALLNGLTDVSQIIGDFHDNRRVKLQTGEYIDLYYNVPELEEGCQRGYFVEFKGYFTIGPESKENPIVDDWDGMSFEDIIAAVLAVQPEAADIMPVLERILELAESVHSMPMEYVVEKIIAENVLPWLKR